MKIQRLMALLIALFALAAAGCGWQPAEPPAVDAEYTLKSALVEGKMVFVGVGGEIDGTVNPELTANTGDMLRVVMINGDGVPHDLAIPDLKIQTSLLLEKDKSSQIVFQAEEAGEFVYYCTVAGHRQVGMEGKFIINSTLAGMDSNDGLP